MNAPVRVTRFGIVGIAFALLVASRAHAGPPLVTDDPVPSPFRHWEIMTPVVVERAGGAENWAFPGLDLNYGGGPNLQLTFADELVWDEQHETRLGDAEFAAKYRFARRGTQDHETQAAFFPRVIVPATTSGNSLAWDTIDYELPLVWLQEFGERTRVYGDAHVTIVHGAGSNPWFAGLAFERDAGKAWTLTGEAYWQTAPDASDAAASGASLGFVRVLRRDPQDEDSSIDLLFSVNRSFASRPDVTVYLGPRFQFR